MRDRSLPRKPVVLSESTQRRLGVYALSATAAGVGALALAQPAEAKIVYTPADVLIHRNLPVELDLNHDGIPDFILSKYYWKPTTFDGIALFGIVSKDSNNGILSGGSLWASALSKGARVGASKIFAANLYIEIVGHDYQRLYGGGLWTGDTVAYLGLKFQIDGKFHYGWARLHVIAYVTGEFNGPLIKATLTGYAYETIPNKAIVAGKTKGPDVITLPLETRAGTLGHLALGRN